MTEAALTSIFAKHLKAINPKECNVYEFKMVKGNRFLFSNVKDHQIEGLLNARSGLWYKIMDSPFGGNNQRFTSKKPFDAVWIVANNAYVVPIFYKERKYKIAVLIPIVDFLVLNKCQKSVSLLELQEMGFLEYSL